MRVDQLEGRVAVVGHLHDVGEAVEREKNGRAAGVFGVELAPESLEDGPGAVGFLGRVDQLQERRVDGDDLRQVGVRVDGVHARQNLLVGLLEGVQELEGVGWLRPEGGVLDGGVFGYGCG